jgi:hypothetical protein
LITARDIALPAWPAAAPAQLRVVPEMTRREWLLRGTLFITVLLSCIAFIEPSPHDVLMIVLLGIALVAGVQLKRFFAPLILLLLLWNIGGLLSLANVPDNGRAITYAAVSIYLAVATLVFAAILSDRTMLRIAVIRSAYILAAAVTAIAGTIGYFNLVPPLYEVLTLYGRATGFFKDPNVYGPFLIWPSLFLAARMLSERLRLRDCALQIVLLVGLLLSVSRGAWMHYLLSGVVMVALLFVTTSSTKMRFRILAITGLGAFGLVAVFVVMMSIPQVGDLLLSRANLVNSYDVGEGGRFGLQEIAIGTILQLPNGMGPFEFARVNGLQQHNVYLQAFIVYGWIGGVAYLLLLATTTLIGLRSALTVTPWQIYAIVSFAVFVGEVGEGLVIDTDHWRHFFLILGLVWGLAAARHSRGDLAAHNGYLSARRSVAQPG